MTEEEALSQPGRVRLLADWDAVIGAGGALVAGQATVVTRRTDTARSEGWVSCVRIGGSLVVSMPSGVDVVRLRDAFADLPTDDGNEPAALARLFDAEAVLGPARLQFRDQVPAHVPVAAVEWSVDERHRDTLLAACSESDLAESGVPEPGQAAAMVVIDGRAVAASWWDPWQESLAHLAVLVVPDRRGLGLAADVAAVAASDAVGQGRVAQWRVRPEVTASVATARRLRFVDLGFQLSLRLRDC